MGNASSGELRAQQAGGGLRGPVGLRNRAQNVTNDARDQAKVIALLAAIPESQGGKKQGWTTKPLAGADRQCPTLLADAIWQFQVFWKTRGVFHNIDGVVDPNMHTWQRLNQLATGAPEPTNNFIKYDVPLVTQGANPICWVCCMAMVASERRKVSVGVGTYLGGFDPSFATIPNPLANIDPQKYQYKDFVHRMSRCGFTSVYITSAADLDETLRERGPLILTHWCAGFPYGGIPTGIPTAFPPGASHAVVITGIDIDAGSGQAWMNNPWGAKSVPISVPSILTAAQNMQSSGPPFAYFRTSSSVD